MRRALLYWLIFDVGTDVAFYAGVWWYGVWPW